MPWTHHPIPCQGTTGASSISIFKVPLLVVPKNVQHYHLLFLLFFLEKGSPVLSNMKDQEIHVDSPFPGESIGQSYGFTPTLLYSHGQAVLPISTSSPLTIPTASFLHLFPKMSLKNIFLWSPPLWTCFTILHCNLLQHLFLILPLILALFYLLHWVPLYMATLFPIYPHTTPLLGSNPLVGSSLSFPQQTFSSQYTLNLWSFSHTIYSPQPVYAIMSYPSISNTFPFFSTLPINTSTTFSNTIPIFTTISNTPKSNSDSLPQRRLTRGWQRRLSRGNTYYSTRKPYSQIFDSHTSPFSNIAFSSSNASWSGHSRNFFLMIL